MEHECNAEVPETRRKRHSRSVVILFGSFLVLSPTKNPDRSWGKALVGPVPFYLRVEGRILPYALSSVAISSPLFSIFPVIRFYLPLWEMILNNLCLCQGFFS